ncbi:TetR family transcriptional regulator [Streptomyces xiamenensis]|uniref:TetR/AcrR family transcriptional regulator n=1 Tax=Streptomyces sp. NRRL F-2890 TaxID=1463845 RepID=UPI0004CBD59B|nr:TetR family transcriptional regulator [Streptomyces sp. NRRL F-2890]
MPPEPLTPEDILRATEDVLRRYGPAKATVVDVARALGVSHGTVYRHFRTKAELREAVTRRWLDRATGELAAIATGEGPAAGRLERWLRALFAAKRRKAVEDPELFATYQVLAQEQRETVSRHIAELVGQLTAIIEAGRASGEFAAGPPDAPTAARAVFRATASFHKPSHAAEWSAPDVQESFEAVSALVIRGLRA